MITHDTIHDRGPDADPTPATNAAAAVCLHAALFALLLAVTLPTGLPLAAAAGLAWLGGACGTVALLLASDARRMPPATAPDL